MNTSRSTDSGTTMFNTLQFQFVNWATRWAKTGAKTEQQPIDLPQLVQLLQALGFYIRRMDGCRPKETTPLRDSQRGIRIIAVCNHSGNRCYLEQPLNENLCKCTKTLTDDSKETFCEIVGPTSSSNQEASVGSDIIPPISKDLNQIIYPVINYLIHMIESNGDAEGEPAVVADTAEKGAVPKRYSDQYYSVKPPTDYTSVKAASSMYNFTKEPAIAASTPYTSRRTDSPTRYRSLDTLTSKGADSGFPEPGKLKAMYSIPEFDTSALSSSNTQLSVEDIVGDSKSTIGESRPSAKTLSLLKNAARDLSHAISRMEANIAEIYSESILESHLTRSIKSAKSVVSSPSKPPLTSRSVSSPSLSKSSSRTIRSLQGKSPKLLAKSTSTNSKTKKFENKPELTPSESTIGVRGSKTKLARTTDFARQTLRRTTNLYAHVKTTIPKPGSSKET